MANCTVDHNTAIWSTRYFVVNCVTSTVGAIGNILSILILYKCQKTYLAIKVQLGSYFGCHLFACLVIVPWISFIHKLSAHCHTDALPKELYVFFLSSFFFGLERIRFATIAIFRLFAVRWPHHYKKMARVKVTVILEICISLYTLLVSLAVLAIFLHLKLSAQEMTSILFSDGKTEDLKAIVIYISVECMLTLFISSMAYVLMIITICRRKHPGDSRRNAGLTEQLTFNISALILANIILDAPHILSHILKGNQVQSFIFHNIYFMYLAIDPILFIVMNRGYREVVAYSLKFLLWWKPRGN